jgi:hypothetical protein
VGLLDATGGRPLPERRCGFELPKIALDQLSPTVMQDLARLAGPFAATSEHCVAALAALGKKLAEEIAAMERANSIGALRAEELAAHLPRAPVPYGPQRKGRGGKLRRW